MLSRKHLKFSNFFHMCINKKNPVFLTSVGTLEPAEVSATRACKVWIKSSQVASGCFGPERKSSDPGRGRRFHPHVSLWSLSQRGEGCRFESLQHRADVSSLVFCPFGADKVEVKGHRFDSPTFVISTVRRESMPGSPSLVREPGAGRRQ